ncbi:MAG: DUF58 domain-containing protein [Anaerolineaceae bacterium]|jgi:uncharacterized protein (DUF58 family)
MTRRFLLLIFFLYSLLFLGLASRTGTVIALAIPFAVYLGAALIFIPGKPELTARRTLSTEHVTQGVTVTVRLEITNLGENVEELLVEDVPPAEVELVQGQTSAVATLSPGKSVDLEYEVKAKRGRYIFNYVQATATDYLGLFERRVTLEAAADLLILPLVLKLHPIPIRPLRTHGFSGPIPSRKVGTGVNFLSIRGYQAGDPLRWINWRVSARHTDELFTNEFELERIADIGIILDARQQSDVEAQDGNLFEYAVQATASLADAFLEDGNRVGLLIYGRGMESTFPGYGKIQRQRILQSLGRARTGSSYAFTSLENLPTRFFPSGSQIVLVSPIDREDVPVLIQLRALGYELMVVSPDSISFEGRHYKEGKTAALAIRVANLDRAMVIHSLRRVGIPVVNWQVESSLDNALHRTVSLMVKKQHILQVSK